MAVLIAGNSRAFVKDYQRTFLHDLIMQFHFTWRLSGNIYYV